MHIEFLISEYKGKKIGSISDMTIFSFHAVKNITTCEGGAIVTNNKEYYDKLKKFRAYGIDKSMLCGLMLCVSESISAKTGWAPQYRIASTVDGEVLNDTLWKALHRRG